MADEDESPEIGKDPHQSYIASIKAGLLRLKKKKDGAKKEINIIMEDVIFFTSKFRPIVKSYIEVLEDLEFEYLRLGSQYEKYIAELHDNIEEIQSEEERAEKPRELAETYYETSKKAEEEIKRLRDEINKMKEERNAKPKEEEPKIEVVEKEEEKPKEPKINFDDFPSGFREKLIKLNEVLRKIPSNERPSKVNFLVEIIKRDFRIDMDAERLERLLILVKKDVRKR